MFGNEIAFTHNYRLLARGNVTFRKSKLLPFSAWKAEVSLQRGFSICEIVCVADIRVAGLFRMAQPYVLEAGTSQS